ncbi:hypothetical protein GGF45_005700, partial [Coemansia sp. RSA 551]
MKQTILCVEQPTLLRIEQSALSRKGQSTPSRKEQPLSHKEQPTPSLKEQPTPSHKEQQRRTPRNTARPIVPREEECWPVTKLLDKYPELRFERWLPSVLRSIEKSSGAVFDERVQRGAL